MTDTAENTESVAPVESESTADIVEGMTNAEPEKLDFVLDKYRAEGRSENDAAFEQAKAYEALQSRFGSFTGAPEDYTLSISEELSDKFDAEALQDDPVLAKGMEIAKEMNMDQEGFNKFANLFLESQIMDEAAIEAVRNEEMAKLGRNADRRLENITTWLTANTDKDSADALMSSLSSAEAVEALEGIIAKTRNMPQSQIHQPAEEYSEQKLQEMLVAKDEYGNPKMNNKEYAAKVNRLYDMKFGAEPNRTVR